MLILNKMLKQICVARKHRPKLFQTQHITLVIQDSILHFYGDDAVAAETSNWFA